MEDSKIISLFWESSEDAITQTAQKYGKYCFAIAFNILSNNEDCEECVNDTYLKTWNSIPPKKPSNFKAFLAKITRNLSLNLYEKRFAQKRGGGQVPLLLSELSECISPNISLSSFEISACINEFLKTLSSQNRRIFIKRYFYALPICDIAKTEQMSENRVSVSLFRLREKLKNNLEKEGISI